MFFEQTLLLSTASFCNTFALNSLIAETSQISLSILILLLFICLVICMAINEVHITRKV